MTKLIPTRGLFIIWVATDSWGVDATKVCDYRLQPAALIVTNERGGRRKKKGVV